MWIGGTIIDLFYILYFVQTELWVNNVHIYM
jgi:hypothetical protein